MRLKAFAITCERFYPGIVSYYAAHSEDGAITQARFSMLKVGGRARRADIKAMHAPEYDAIAEKLFNPGCIDHLLHERIPG